MSHCAHLLTDILLRIIRIKRLQKFYCSPRMLPSLVFYVLCEVSGRVSLNIVRPKTVVTNGGRFLGGRTLVYGIIFKRE